MSDDSELYQARAATDKAMRRSAPSTRHAVAQERMIADAMIQNTLKSCFDVIARNDGINRRCSAVMRDLLHQMAAKGFETPDLPEILEYLSSKSH